MTSREAMIFQLKKLKGKPCKEIIGYILTYYWIPIVIGVVSIVFLFSIIVNQVTQKDPALTVCCINAATKQEASKAYGAQFAKDAGIDLSEYEVRIITNLNIKDSDTMASYQSAQALLAMIASESLDVIVSDQETILQCTYADYCADLSQLLTDEQMERYQQFILYMDMEYLSQVQNAETLDGHEPAFPDPAQQEEMGQPIPVALMLPADSEFVNLFFPHIKEDIALSVVVNSQNLSHALRLLEYVQ